jgi:hypothetical protein
MKKTVFDYEDQIEINRRLTTKNHQGNDAEPQCHQRRDVNNNRPSVLVNACSIVERSKRQIGVAGGNWEHHHHRGHPSTILLLHYIAPPQGHHKWSSSRNSQCGHSNYPLQVFPISARKFCKLCHQKSVF